MSKLVGQLALEKFAGRYFGNFLYEANRLRALVIGEAAATKRDDLFFRCLSTLFQDDKGRDFFSVKLIRHSDCRSRSHGGMLIEYFVDLAWIDVFSATNNHVALAIDDIEEAVRIAVTNDPGVKPAVAKCRGSCLGISLVPFQNILASQHYFTEFAISYFLIILVDYLHVVANRHAAGPRPAPQVGRIESRTTG